MNRKGNKPKLSSNKELGFRKITAGESHIPESLHHIICLMHLSYPTSEVNMQESSLFPNLPNLPAAITSPSQLILEGKIYLP